MKDEYMMLREEILKETTDIENYKSLLYTLVLAFFAFSFEKNNSWMFLFPFIAIFPLFNMINKKIDSTIRTGTYILVFLEPYIDIKWETNLYLYDVKHKNQFSTKKMNIDSFVLISIICIALSIISLDMDNISDFNVWGCIILQVALSVYSIWIFYTKRIDYVSRKEKYIKEWKQIKDSDGE